MKNFDATRRWLKCTMGWTRHDRCWGGQGHERWCAPAGHPRANWGRSTYESALRRAKKDAAEQGISIPDFKAEP